MMNKTTIGIVSGASIVILGIGIYFLRKSKRGNPSLVDSDSKGTPIRLSNPQMGIPITEPNWNNPFDMNYLKDVKAFLQGKPILELPMQTAMQYASILHKAKGGFFEDDDEKAVESIFKRLQDKTQVASLSKAFYTLFKKDLWRYLKSFLNDSEMETLVHKPVRRLERYRLRT
ncbi:hypothetical protein [Aquimarina algicola]|uniref:Uncharacterized protein n=1 Tax=Aquimarina algicola TaxID=2589995 RepID=A0A504JH82_9FLAO|nr:hypothetical protein [Aquimarina algicola]TPN85791.1 hypothetical protein FHK87_10910 [Aquimarina algicola]